MCWVTKHYRMSPRYQKRKVSLFSEKNQEQQSDLAGAPKIANADSKPLPNTDPKEVIHFAYT